MADKLEDLEELHNVIYNCEDMIDGQWSEITYPEFDEVNEFHEHTLNTLRGYMAIIRSRIKEEKKDKVD